MASPHSYEMMRLNLIRAETTNSNRLNKPSSYHEAPRRVQRDVACYRSWKRRDHRHHSFKPPTETAGKKWVFLYPPANILLIWHKGNVLNARSGACRGFSVANSQKYPESQMVPYAGGARTDIVARWTRLRLLQRNVKRRLLVKISTTKRWRNSLGACRLILIVQIHEAKMWRNSLRDCRFIPILQLQKAKMWRNSLRVCRLIPILPI